VIVCIKFTECLPNWLRVGPVYLDVNMYFVYTAKLYAYIFESIM